MFDWLIDWVNARINDLKSWALGLFATISYVWNTVVADVKRWVLTIWDGVTAVYNTIVNYITQAYNTVTNYITNVINNVVNYITNVINNIVNYISNTYNTIVNNITNVIGVTIEKVAEWFTSIGGATKAWVEGLFVKANNVWNSITGNLGEWWKTQLALINETFGWVLLFRDGITEFFTDPEEWLYKAADRIIERFW